MPFGNRWQYASQTATRNREKWEATWRSASTAKCCRVLYARSFAARRIAIKRSHNSFAREPKPCTFRERACLLKIAATGKISISRKFVDVYRQNRVLYILQQQCHFNECPNFIFIFDNVACDKQNTVREYFSTGRHANVNCFLSVRCTSDTRQRESADPVQTRRLT